MEIFLLLLLVSFLNKIHRIYFIIFVISLVERGFVIIVALLATNVTAYAFSQISEIVKFEDTKK